MLAEALTEGSELLVALTVCAPGCAPGLNRPAEDIVPTVVLPPTAPSTDQLTPLFWESLETVAVNCWVWESVTAARFGLSVTETEDEFTMKLSPLLASPFTVTTTFPVVAPLGTVA